MPSDGNDPIQVSKLGSSSGLPMERTKTHYSNGHARSLRQILPDDLQADLSRNQSCKDARIQLER